MSKGLCNYNGSERRVVIDRRIRNNAGGLGTIAAREAVERELAKVKQTYVERVVELVKQEVK